MTIRFIQKGKAPMEVDCYRSLNLLGHAQLEELDIGSQCGGHGVCGGDRIQIDLTDQKLLSPLTDAEKEHLSLQELNAGWRLGCQCWPNQDKIEIGVHIPQKKKGP